MEKEFNLSEKIVEIMRSDGTHNLTDFDKIGKNIKEFIKKIKEDDYMELARWLHDVYEQLSKVAGWETRKECQVKFDDLPMANKKAMYNVAIALIQRNKEKADKLAGDKLI